MRAVAALALLAALAAAGCGSASVTTPTPSPGSPPPTLPPPPYIATITSSGVSPQVLHVWSGRTAVFVNSDSRPRAFFADPHAAHTECAGVLNMGTLKPGERREIANLPINFCFFHEESDPQNRAFQGVVVVH